jgi:hypothetical protein
MWQKMVLLPFAICCSLWPHGYAMKRSHSFALDVDADSTSDRPVAPTSLKDLLNWAPPMLDQLVGHPQGRVIVEGLASSLRAGVQVNTDYFGCGAPEIALRSLQQAMQERSSNGGNILLWRASDILPSRRQMLIASGNEGPAHVFGDLLSRVGLHTFQNALAAQ